MKHLVKSARAYALPAGKLDLLTNIESMQDSMSAFADLVEKYVEDIESKVIRMQSSEGAEKIYIAKVRAEGARQLLTEIRKVLS